MNLEEKITIKRALESLRIQQESDGLYLVCDRGRVAQLLAGYGQTQQEDAQFLQAAPALYALAQHLRAMADDAYLQGHPEWGALAEEAHLAVCAVEGRRP